MSVGAWRTGELHVSWSLAYWRVTCQLELGVLASENSAGDWSIGKLRQLELGVLASYMSAGAWCTGK